MGQLDSLNEQIKKAEAIRADSLENLKNNPDDYSAKLLMMSIENHLTDLFKQLDIEKGLLGKPED